MAKIRLEYQRQLTRVLPAFNKAQGKYLSSGAGTAEGVIADSIAWDLNEDQDNYRGQIEAAGMKVVKVQANPTYQFISDNAGGASKKFGVKSISLLAVKR